jgi:hypothetical protein
VPKRSERDALLLKAIRATFGNAVFTAADVIAKAAEALTARQRSAKSLGHDLKRLVRAAAAPEGWRLCGRKDRHRHMWRYRFFDLASMPPGYSEDCLDRLVFEELIHRVGPVTQVRELAHSQERAERRQEERAEAQAIARTLTGGPTLAVETLPARVKCGPDGRPVPADPELPPPKAAPEQPKSEAPTMRRRPRDPLAILREEERQPTRAEWDAWQRYRTGTDGAASGVTGFADPAGVVSQNINRERRPPGWRWSQDL